MSVHAAVKLSIDEGLDLVEVAPNAKPPVCKIMDYGKFKYEQSKRAKEAKKNQTHIVVKEVKLRPKTEEHDFQHKLRRVKQFLEDGNKVKVTVQFRGREITHTQLGFDLLTKVVDQVKEEAVIEQNPKMEGKQIVLILGPGKTIQK